MPKAVDALTSHYVGLLGAGEGPAAFSLHARDTARLEEALDRGGFAFRTAGGLTEIGVSGLDFVFFVRDSRSPTDRPEHFAHDNGSTALRAIWVATEHGEALVRLLVHLGGTIGGMNESRGQRKGPYRTWPPGFAEDSPPPQGRWPPAGPAPMTSDGAGRH